MFFPIMIDIENMNIIIVGGGKIGYKKAKFISQLGKKVKVISKEFCSDFNKNEFEVELVKKEFQMSDLEEADIVYAALDNSKLNTDIANYCKINRILVNSVDDRKKSNFINTGFFTEKIEDTDVMVSVSTFGNNCKMARDLRDELKAYLED
ncbi:precorrin-2 dehydrogenase/sirohydrochlorin ferrochelatase family protein [Peptostreptococcus equinus]|uniref:precorrin-2 dehydrogenase n=1 Tax=Peptostreptococcus equinus TaxID=3003601 RepID=A0ABY7JP20_9FIRM|nr:NAD(P)-dependent oxidoreductase [Peptostreptococcus sp. CBA3647]WAW15115.1 bifunctional precorrin-2 dehydrogenase/sirohydrochlorin ferrochelatase [Peptostreptococcus sp. CBA3647]